MTGNTCVTGNFREQFLMAESVYIPQMMTCDLVVDTTAGVFGHPDRHGNSWNCAGWGDICHVFNDVMKFYLQKRFVCCILLQM
jgi:hypothetical protein